MISLRNSTGIKTQLYVASVLPLKDETLYRLAYDNASVERRQKTDGYRFAKDRRLSLGADMLLRYALREANEEFDPARIRTGTYGKPYFENAGIYFNISHSEERVICVISDSETGCDIEKIRSADLKIAGKTFCPEEYTRISRQASDEERDLLFYRYWTLKESFIKATGLGLNLPFNEFCIEIGGDIRIRQSVDQRVYSFTEFSSIQGYCCAVCTTGEKKDVKMNEIDLSEI